MSNCYSLIALLTIAVMAMVGCGKGKEAVNDLPHFCTQDGSRLLIKQGDIQLEVMPKVGGRISSLKYGNHEILVPIVDLDKVTDWGTVLWSSPQTDWGWPPIDVLDHKPYRLSTLNNAIVLTSEIDSRTGYQFTKTYRLAGDDRIAIDYRITNHSEKTKSVAPLEVTRLPSSGSLFFPSGEGEVSNGLFYPLAVQMIDQLTWFDYDRKKIRTDHHKMMSDGKEGWLAYVDQGYLLVKEFNDSPAGTMAKGENEIEIFAHVDHIFIEMKQQASLVELESGAHLDWTVIWHVKKLPEDLALNPTPQALSTYVRSLLTK
jgi:hypothetical protein